MAIEIQLANDARLCGFGGDRPRWKVIQREGKNYQIFEWANSKGLSEIQAVAQAKLLLSHLKAAGETDDPPAIAILGQSKKMYVAVTELSPKESSLLRKTGAARPLVFRYRSAWGEDLVRDHILNLDTLGFASGFADPFERAILRKAAKEIAQTKPQFLYAFILKLLVEENRNTYAICRELCQELKNKALSIPDLLKACEEHRSRRFTRFVTSNNAVHLGMVLSGFDPKVIELMKERGFSFRGRWFGLLPVQLAAIVGAGASVLKAIEGDAASMPFDVNHLSVDSFVEGFFKAFCRENDEKAKQVLERCLPDERDPLFLLKRELRDPNADPLADHPYRAAAICALPFFSSREKIDMITLLLERHRDSQSSYYLNYALRGGARPLQNAIAYQGDGELIRFLIEHGASIEPSLMQIAAAAWNLEALQVLEERGVGTEKAIFDALVETFPKSPSEAATRCLAFFLEKKWPLSSNNALQALRCCLAAKDVRLAVECFKQHPVAFSVLADEALPTEVLIAAAIHAKSQKENLDAIFVERVPLLIAAIMRQEPQLIKALLDAGVSCAFRFNGMTPRTFAHLFKHSSPEIVQMLEQGRGEDDERTPFHAAAVRGDIKQCQYYLSQGGDLPLDRNGLSPLHLVVYHGHSALAPLFFNALKEKKVSLFSPPPQIISKKTVAIHLPSSMFSSIEEETFFRTSLCGGSLIAQALFISNAQMAEEIWTYFIEADPPMNLQDEESSKRRRTFGILYDLACRNSLSAFQRGYQWLVDKCKPLHEEPLIAAVAAKNHEAARWLCQNSFQAMVKSAGAEALDLAVERDDAAMIELLVGFGARATLHSLLAAAKKENRELFFPLLDSVDKNIELEPVMPLLLSSPKHVILQEWIRTRCSLCSSDAEQVIECMEETFQGMERIPPALLQHLLRNAQSLSEWNSQMRAVKKFIDSFGAYEHLISQDAFFKEIFRRNWEEPLFTLMQEVKSKRELALYFNALRRGSSIENLRVVLKVAKQREPADTKKQEWLTYFAETGCREGFQLAWKTIREEKDPQTLYLGLCALEKIGAGVPIKKALSSLSPFFDHPVEALRAQAARTLWAMAPDPYSGESKEAILTALQNSNSKETICVLIDLLGNYEYQSESYLDFTVVKSVMQYSTHEDQGMRVASALTLSRMTVKPALTRAAEIVKGPDWDHIEPSFEEEDAWDMGAWWTFSGRPGLREGRSAILSRIQDSLAYVQLLNATSIPIHFPIKPGKYLMRGIFANKGDPHFANAVRDLIREGCRPADLTQLESVAEPRWAKIGSTLAAHPLKITQHFSQERQGCLILIDPIYYQVQSRKGFARIEREGPINIVFYHGIPKYAIQKIYLPQELEHDLRALNADKPIDEKFRSKLTSDVFKDRPIAELLQFRAYLHEKSESPPIISHLPLYSTFFDRFRFVGPEENLPSRLKQDGVKEYTAADIAQATFSAAVARDNVVEFIPQPPAVDVPHFSELAPRVFRSAEPSHADLEHLKQKRGVKTLICLRRKDSIHDYAKQLGMEVIFLPLDGKLSSYSDAKILSCLQAVLNAESPALLYCQCGADRTGFMSAAYLYIVQGVSLETAIKELKRFKSTSSYSLHPLLEGRLKVIDRNYLRKQLDLPLLYTQTT